MGSPGFRGSNSLSLGVVNAADSAGLTSLAVPRALAAWNESRPEARALVQGQGSLTGLQKGPTYRQAMPICKP